MVTKISSTNISSAKLALAPKRMPMALDLNKDKKYRAAPLDVSPERRPANNVSRDFSQVISFVSHVSDTRRQAVRERIAGP